MTNYTFLDIFFWVASIHSSWLIIKYITVVRYLWANEKSVNVLGRKEFINRHRDNIIVSTILTAMLFACLVIVVYLFFNRG